MKNMKVLNKIGCLFKCGLSMKRVAMSVVLCGLMQLCNAQIALTKVIPAQTEEGTELRLFFNGIPVQPKAYKLDHPSRLVLDFEGVKNDISSTNLEVNSSEASSLSFESDAQRSRIVVNLKDYGAFTTRSEGNTLIFKISAQTHDSIDLASNVQSFTAQAQGLSDIGFARGKQGEGLVNLSLLSAQTPVDVQQQGSKIVIRFLGSKIPTHLARRLNVNDFATPVSSIDAYNEGGNGVVVIQPVGSYEYMAYQTENQLTISVKAPAQKNTTAQRSQQNYSGKKISLDFQDIEVRRVLQLLADFTDTNIVAADSVQGNITVHLKDVPWDQALDIILKTKKLDKRRNGQVIWIAPVTELIKADEDEAKALAQSNKLAPIQTDYIQLKYAKVLDIEKLITDRKQVSTSGSSSSSNDELSGNMLSPRGSVSSDVRTNTLIINDTAVKIDEIRKMVDLLDISVKQVMVEARVVRASDTFSKDLGVKWGIASKNDDFYVAGDRSSLSQLNDSDTTQYSDLDDNVNVDLGVENAAGQITFGLIDFSDFMLDLELSASQAEGLTEVISTPKVMTADKQKAWIKSGVEIPYQTTSTSGSTTATTTEFKDAVLLLEVTPSITPDGKVLMQLNITKDAQDGYAQNGEALISTNEIVTNVLVGNGETVVLGGVFEDTTSNTVTKIPFLGDLPYIGRFFRNTSKSKEKEELLIFVTPRIVNDMSATNR
jgi:type IV pilus assembly protein PilQ